MPIPKYLKDVAYSEKSKKNFTSFKIKCKCGCIHFDLYENFLNKEEKKICKPYFDALDYSITGGYGSSCTIDEDGHIHHWIHLTFSSDGPKKEVFIPPQPACACIFSVKAICSECGTEYLIFDNRFHGYDGKLSCELSDEEKIYIPHYKKKRRKDNLPIQLIIEVEHDMNFDDFKEDIGIDCQFEDYTESFTWIVIYTIDSKGKKRKIVDLETG